MLYNYRSHKGVNANFKLCGKIKIIRKRFRIFIIANIKLDSANTANSADLQVFIGKLIKNILIY